MISIWKTHCFFMRVIILFIIFMTGCFGVPEYDETQPVLIKAEIQKHIPDKIYVRFDRSMTEVLPEAPAGFFVTKNETVIQITNVEIDQDSKVILLTLRESVNRGDSVMLSYSGDPVLYAEMGGELSGLGWQYVYNNFITTDKSPVVEKTFIKENETDRIYIQFDKEIQDGLSTNPAGFSVTVGGADLSVLSMNKTGSNTLVLFLNSDILPEDAVIFSYSGIPQITAVNGYSLNPITNQYVANNLSLVFWNKMEGIFDGNWMTSEKGYPLGIATNAGLYDIACDRNFIYGKFGRCLVPAGGPYYPLERAHNMILYYLDEVLNSEKGAIEIWFMQVSNPAANQYNPYRIFDGSYGYNSGISLQSDTDGLLFSVKFGGSSVSARLPVSSFSNLNNNWCIVDGIDCEGIGLKV